MQVERELATSDTDYQVVITPPSGWKILDLGELWYYRDLFLHLVWRDLKVRYKQTILGASWAILEPLVTMVVFTIFFGNFAQIPSNGIPYPLFSYAALVPWTFFASGVTGIANSIISNTNMLKKIYFPRLILPLSTLVSNLVNFALAFAVLLLMVTGYMIMLTYDAIQISPTALQDLAAGDYFILVPPLAVDFTVNILWTVPLILLAFITALGFGLWLAALNVQFRDVRFATGFIIRLWLFITPVIYPADLIQENLQFVYFLNPMAGVIEGFRWAILGTNTAPGSEIFISIGAAVVLLVSGLIYFDKMEKWFADVA